MQTTNKILIFSDVIEWKTYQQFMAKKPKDYIYEQLKELVTNEALQILWADQIIAPLI